MNRITIAAATIAAAFALSSASAFALDQGATAGVPAVGNDSSLNNGVAGREGTAPTTRQLETMSPGAATRTGSMSGRSSVDGTVGGTSNGK